MDAQPGAPPMPAGGTHSQQLNTRTSQSAGGDRAVRAWQLDPHDLGQELETRMPRALTAAEQHRYRLGPSANMP